MTPDQFLRGRLSGWGVVRDFRGRVLRRFHIEMNGVWSDEHRALHLDETYAYVGGPARQRRWVIHSDAEGHLLGHDAEEAARLRGRRRGADFEMIFDRLIAEGTPAREPRQRVSFLEVGPDHVMMVGEIRRFGLTLARLHAALARLP